MFDYQILSKQYFDLVDLDLVREHLKLSCQEDGLLESLIKCSIDVAEGFLRLALVKQIVNFKSKFSTNVALPVRYFSKINKIEVEEGTSVPEVIEYSMRDNSLILSATRSAKIEIEYTAAYSNPEGPPAEIKHGLLKHISNIYDKGNVALDLELLSIYHPYRVVRI